MNERQRWRGFFALFMELRGKKFNIIPPRKDIIAA